jgi:hypothetical protein
LMDELEDLGVIGRPQSGGRTREVLIGKDEDPFDQLVANGEDEEDSSS